ncbi:MAG TPA: hypothetical protein VIQ99_01660, partial [Gammaproteobacteria bacterium]
MRFRLLLGSTLVLAAPLASAQEWDWTLTPYLWASGIDGDASVGPVQADLSVNFGDIVDVLAGAALMHVEAQTDDHGYFGDLVYLATEIDEERVRTELDTTIVELGYLRRTSRIGLEFGIRYWDFDLEIDPTTLPTAQGESDWVDGFVGIRSVRELGDKWNLTTRANIGAGGTDFTYGVGVIFGREIGSSGQFVAGLKLLDIDYEDTT